MNSAELMKLFDELTCSAESILRTKGVEYSGQEDRLANFKRVSRDITYILKEWLWNNLKIPENYHELSPEELKKQIIEQIEFTPQMALWVYMTKHLDSLKSIIAGRQSVEGTKGRIVDVINYAILLYALEHENIKYDNF